MSWAQIATTQQLLGDEQGTIVKDWGGKLPIALVFPNSYFLGMSSLAVHTLYQQWNSRNDVVCERFFTDWTPPLSLESGAPLSYFPVIALTISHELDFFNVVSLLGSSELPLRAAERGETDPILIAGGPAISANPEPLAPILDACLIGEVEPVLAPLTGALQLISESRADALDALAQLPGVYLPHHGSLAVGGSARLPSPVQTVRRQWLRNLDSRPTHSCILTPHTEFKNMGLIEISRGCGRGCRFCLAGFAYRPPRHRAAGVILEQAEHLLRSTERLGLVGAAVSDHPQIDRLAVELRAMGATISVSSMRVDPISEPLIRALAESGTQTLTIAPESGSDRLRRVINKTQTQDDVLRSVDIARRHGLTHLKLYFMLGLPGERQEDVQAIVDLAATCAQRFSRQVTVNITPFVPKAHTPFERSAQTPAKVVKMRIDYVQSRLRSRGIAVRSESPPWAEIQGILARGDRRLAEALLAIQRLTPAAWKKTLARLDIDAEELLRERSADEQLPWSHIESGVEPRYLEREARRSTSGDETPSCGLSDCATCRRCGLEG